MNRSYKIPTSNMHLNRSISGKKKATWDIIPNAGVVFLNHIYLHFGSCFSPEPLIYRFSAFLSLLVTPFFFFFFLVLQNSGLLHEMLESTNADSKSWKVCLMILLLFNLYSSLIIITHCVANIDLFVLVAQDSSIVYFFMYKVCFISWNWSA